MLLDVPPVWVEGSPYVACEMGETREMPVYAISDLHFFSPGARALSPRGLIFEPAPRQLLRTWRKRIEPEAAILIPGDISDSSARGGLFVDCRLLDSLPGKQKILSPGNHDGGPWRAQAKIARFLEPFETLIPIVYGAIRLSASEDAPGLVVAACRGACAPGDQWFGDELTQLGSRNPRRRYELEITRLEQALERAQGLRRANDELIVQIHYPPFKNFVETTLFSAMIEGARADCCVYGHLHAEEDGGFEGWRGSTRFRSVAAPRLGFTPLRLGTLTSQGMHS